jgi:hypothetical protein
MVAVRGGRSLRKPVAVKDEYSVEYSQHRLTGAAQATFATLFKSAYAPRDGLQNTSAYCGFAQ